MKDSIWIVQLHRPSGDYPAINYWGPYCCEKAAKKAKEWDPKTCELHKFKRGLIGGE